MNRTFTLVIFGLFTLILSSFSVLQQLALDRQNQTIYAQNTALREAARSIKLEMQTSERIKTENQFLLDSIEVLNVQVASLSEAINRQTETIHELNGKLKRRLSKYEDIEKKIKWLQRDRETNLTRIRELEKEKSRLERQIADFENAKKQQMTELAQSEDEKMQLTLQEAKLRKIKTIAEQTWVNYNAISVRKKEHRGALQIIGMGDDKWKFTVVSLNLTNPEIEVLTDEQFILKIVNSETGELLPYLEANPEYPASLINTTGVSFQFKNNPVDITHVNVQQKNGMNYEVRIYYVTDGQEHLLKNSVKPILIHGKPFSL
jgi:hypothetical protein